ncbi:MAG: acetylxylan esterase [Bacteroidales bacterium]|nr:acetylxylan esterase [Bacteroidales bacterium]
MMRTLSFLSAALALCISAAAQQPVVFTSAQDHRNMMEQLGIRSIRPSYDGNPAGANPANYDESKANPYPVIPDALRLKDGRRISTAEQWWSLRRPEIVEDFSREVYGRVPENVPPVDWKIESEERGWVGYRPVRTRRITGHVDNSACPEIDVDIRMVLVTPAVAEKPVPVLMMFWPAFFPAPAGPAAQLISAGWGYCIVDPSSIQADFGAGLTKGIIGLVNKGQPRRPDDWGALRAWAWGASRGLDYLETDPTVDAGRVGIEGVSRYGKAALVAMAFEERFAMALIGSSGKGGAVLHRRNFGEGLENLANAGEYHWMAGNYIKYAAISSKSGPGNAGMLPVDSHELIALCAPRLVFISYGIPEKGDDLWMDQYGSWQATVAAGEVYELLGVPGLGRSADYRNEPMPPVCTGLLEGNLAWRQHDGGHTDAPNMQYFIEWADRMSGREL